MKKIYSIAIFIPLLFLQICSSDENVITNGAEAELRKSKTTKKTVILKTVDHFGNPASLVDLVYQQIDCEYDFTKHFYTTTNKKGYGKLKLELGYLQMYASKFLHESYFCTTITAATDTLTIYAAAVPTFIVVRNTCNEPIPNQTIVYWPNYTGNCDFETGAQGTEVTTDANGKATIYLPFQDTYKIQVETYGGRSIQCFQPSQQPETVTLTVGC
jgi:hypothetical protein